MQRKQNSHKGDNGVVAIIGGSRYMHGAPIIAALAAEASGVDLIFPCVPEIHENVTRTASQNFIVHPFRGNDLSKSDVSALEDVIAVSSAVVVGPGLAQFDTAQKAMQQLISDAKVPFVVDASALQSWTFDAVKGKHAVLTPHIRELGRMQGQVLEKKSDEVKKDLVCTIAKERKATMILKGPVDIISGADGKCKEVKGGNSGLTVGGTGDALAGLIAGLIAQGTDPFEACVMATTIIKRAATVLFHEKGFAFRTVDVIEQIPHLLHTYE